MIKVQSKQKVSNPSINEIRARIDARAALAWRVAQLYAQTVTPTGTLEGGVL